MLELRGLLQVAVCLENCALCTAHKTQVIRRTSVQKTNLKAEEATQK